MLAVIGSGIIWGTLLYGASARSGRGRWIAAVAFITLLTFCFGGQRYFFEQYNVYLNAEAWAFAANFKASVLNQLLADRHNYLFAQVPALSAAVLLVWLGRRWVRPRRTPSRIAQRCWPVVLAFGLFTPVRDSHLQAAPPDVLCLTAVGELARSVVGLGTVSVGALPRLRESLPVPALSSQSEPPRNVLLILLESVRADTTCIEYDPRCRKTPATNRLTPQRFPLTQLRSLTSSTAVSLGVLWSGVGPHESHEVLHTWPLLFDYARAAGWDTAFWTSQNMLFGNGRLWVKNLGVSKFVSATELEPDCDLDLGADEGLLAERVALDLNHLREPFFAVIQLSNTHYPYWVDPEGPQPFQPASRSKSADDTLKFFNHYQNAIHQQDQYVGDMIANLRSLPLGERTVIVYTSDHAEAFREHGQMGHTFSVLDEEIHVPGWIDAPVGILSEEQVVHLTNKRTAYTFHVDLSATILDLMGVWDEPGIAKYRSKMLGVSLLRSETNTNALPLTNCTGVWNCAFQNWGYMRQHLKLEAREWDSTWHCFDLRFDAKERNDLGPRACDDLAARAEATFGHLPGRDR
ncbi:MAG TPA: sulfatase-like hydrolase/transferase [Polyangiaceae bacterium]|nr:sulfatase-like hydrolase/transferase [Polyangiaceae bacterium]